MSTPIPLSKIRTTRFKNIREHTEEDIQAMMASIAKVGMLQPLIVIGPSHGEYDLVIGFCRYEAARRLDLKYVPVRVTKAKSSEVALQQLVENMRRTDMTELEQARAFQSLVDAGMSQADLVQPSGLSKVQISRRLKLLKAAPEVIEALESRNIIYTDARRISDLPKADQLPALEEAIGPSVPVVQVTEAQGEPLAPEPPIRTPKEKKKPEAKRGTSAQRKQSADVKQAVAKRMEESRSNVDSRAGKRAGSKKAEIGERYLSSVRPKFMAEYSAGRDLTARETQVAESMMDWIFAKGRLIIGAKD